MRIFTRSSSTTVRDSLIVAAGAGLAAWAVYDASQAVGKARDSKRTSDGIRLAADGAERIRKIEEQAKAETAAKLAAAAQVRARHAEALKAKAVVAPKVEVAPEAPKAQAPDMGDAYLRMAAQRAEAQKQIDAQAKEIAELKAALASAAQSKLGRPTNGRKPAAPTATA